MASRRELLRGLLAAPALLVRSLKPEAIERPIQITEAEYARLYAALWAMGYAIVPSMPIYEDAIRSCHDDICDVIFAIQDREHRDVAALICKHL